MAANFFHWEAYAIASSGGKPNVASVIGEASRDPGFIPHVGAPRPPVILHGIHPRDIPALIVNRIVGTKTTAGAPVSGRSLSLLTAVVSWPVLREHVRGNKELATAYIGWREANLAFFKRWVGEALVSVIEHQDEAYLHLHVYAVPVPNDAVFGIDMISKPHCAQLEAQRTGGSRREQRQAFRAAARELQDEYYLQVGEPCGLDRTGPRRPRLTRAEFKARERDEALRKTAEEKRTEAAVAAATRATDETIHRLRQNLRLSRQLSNLFLRDLRSRGVSEAELQKTLQAFREALSRSEEIRAEGSGPRSPK